MTLLGLAIWSVCTSRPLPSNALIPIAANPRIGGTVVSKSVARLTSLRTAEPYIWTLSNPVVETQPISEGKPRTPQPPIAKSKWTTTIDDAAEEARLCSIAMNGAPVETIVRTLVGQSRLNLVLLGGQKTPVTLNLRNVPLIEAVRHLCVLGNLRFVRLPHTLAIGPEDTLKASYATEWAKQYPAPVPPAVVEPPKAPEAIQVVVHLAHIPAPAVVTTLDGLFKEKGLVAVAAPRPTVPTLSTVETTSTGASANVGLAGQTESASRTLVLQGPPDVVNAARALIASLDTARAQVQIAVTMHDVSNNAMKDLGIQWSFNNVTLTESSDRSFLFGNFNRSNLGFSAVIRALETRDQARLIASPNVSVMDGERGFVLIGDRLKFPELIGYSQANTPIFNTKEERVGVYMQVSGNVSPDGYVTLTLAPQVSTVSGFLEVGGSSYPQISTREAQSTLRVKSGETIVLGGLMRDDEIANMERVPILSQLPILGELFKRRKKTRNTSQLVISVTPTIVLP